MGPPYYPGQLETSRESRPACGLVPSELVGPWRGETVSQAHRSELLGVGGRGPDGVPLDLKSLQ